MATLADLYNIKAPSVAIPNTASSVDNIMTATSNLTKPLEWFMQQKQKQAEEETQNKVMDARMKILGINSMEDYNQFDPTALTGMSPQQKLQIMQEYKAAKEPLVKRELAGIAADTSGYRDILTKGTGKLFDYDAAENAINEFNSSALPIKPDKSNALRSLDETRAQEEQLRSNALANIYQTQQQAIRNRAAELGMPELAGSYINEWQENVGSARKLTPEQDERFKEFSTVLGARKAADLQQLDLKAEQFKNSNPLIKSIGLDNEYGHALLQFTGIKDIAEWLNTLDDEAKTLYWGNNAPEMRELLTDQNYLGKYDPDVILAAMELSRKSGSMFLGITGTDARTDIDQFKKLVTKIQSSKKAAFATNKETAENIFKEMSSINKQRFAIEADYASRLKQGERGIRRGEPIDPRQSFIRSLLGDANASTTVTEPPQGTTEVQVDTGTTPIVTEPPTASEKAIEVLDRAFQSYYRDAREATPSSVPTFGNPLPIPTLIPSKTADSQPTVEISNEGNVPTTSVSEASRFTESPNYLSNAQDLTSQELYKDTPLGKFRTKLLEAENAYNAREAERANRKKVGDVEYFNKKLEELGSKDPRVEDRIKYAANTDDLTALSELLPGFPITYLAKLQSSIKGDKPEESPNQTPTSSPIQEADGSDIDNLTRTLAKKMQRTTMNPANPEPSFLLPQYTPEKVKPSMNYDLTTEEMNAEASTSSKTNEINIDDTMIRKLDNNNPTLRMLKQQPFFAAIANKAKTRTDFIRRMKEIYPSDDGFYNSFIFRAAKDLVTVGHLEDK